MLGGTIGYLASDGDWAATAAGAIAGGIAGGISFDAKTSRFNVGTEVERSISTIAFNSKGFANAMNLTASVARNYINLASNNLKFHSSFVYIKDGHLFNHPAEFKILAGQHVRIELMNQNFLWVQLQLSDESMKTKRKTLFGLFESEASTGDSHTFNLFPSTSKYFDFHRFDHSPMIWKFKIDTAPINDVAQIRVIIHSNWLHEDQIPPGHPRKGYLEKVLSK